MSGTNNKQKTLDNASVNDGIIYTQGKVIGMDGNVLYIEAQTQNGCAGCSAQNGCGTSALSKLFAPRNRKPLQLENTVGAQLNDSVELSTKESHLVKHSIMAYGIPLIMLMTGAWLLLTVTQNDLLSALGGFLGLGVGWWWTQKVYQPVLPKLERVLRDERRTNDNSDET